MAVDTNAESLEFFGKGIGACLSAVSGDYDARHQKVTLPESVDETQHLTVVGDVKVVSDLVALDVACVDGDDDLHAVL